MMRAHSPLLSTLADLLLLAHLGGAEAQDTLSPTPTFTPTVTPSWTVNFTQTKFPQNFNEGAFIGYVLGGAVGGIIFLVFMFCVLQRWAQYRASDPLRNNQARTKAAMIALAQRSRAASLGGPSSAAGLGLPVAPAAGSTGRPAPTAPAEWGVTKVVNPLGAK